MQVKTQHMFTISQYARAKKWTRKKVYNHILNQPKNHYSFGFIRFGTKSIVYDEKIVNPDVDDSNVVTLI